MKKLLLILLCLPFYVFSQCISGDCSNGYGEFIYENGNGNKYIGFTKNNLRHGEGKYIVKYNERNYPNHHPDFIIEYSGQWKKNIPHGVLTTTTRSGNSDTRYYNNGKAGKFINFTGNYIYFTEGGESGEELTIFESEVGEENGGINIAYIAYNVWQPSENDDEDGTWGTDYRYFTNVKLNGDSFISDQYNGLFKKTNNFNSIQDSSFVLYDEENDDTLTFYKSDNPVRIEGWLFSIFKFDYHLLHNWAMYQNLNLKILRNEIFARHGYIFQYGGEMDNYFSEMSWYQPVRKNVDHLLSEIEKHNIKVIQKTEKSVEKSKEYYKKNKASFDIYDRWNRQGYKRSIVIE